MSTDPTNQSTENSKKVNDEQEQKKVEEKSAAAENKVENQAEQEEEIDIDLNDQKVQETAAKMQNMFFKKKGFGKKKE